MLEWLRRRGAAFRRQPAFTGFCLFMMALLLNIIIQTPEKFFTTGNLRILFTKNTPLILTCLGQAVLMMSGVLDLSAGIQLAFVNVIAIMLPQELGFPVAAGWGIALLGGVAVSMFCGFCIVKLRLPALLATFSITYIIRGVNVLIMSQPQGKVDKVIYKTYDSLVLGAIPFAALIILFVMLAWAYISRTRYGKHMYAVGNNPLNAYAAGISPQRVQMTAFLIKGVLIGMAGLALTASNASGNPLQAEEYGIRSLSACILGGMNFGGWGTFSSGLYGSGFLVLVQNSVYYLFNFLTKAIPGLMINSYWQNFVSDLIIFLGLLATIITSKAQRETLRQGFVRQLKRGEKYA
ncbi:MAG TPA: ABC transporter permease [Candidatus Limnocylindria bacterium]|nr:ABC transporter permease [Candidatus Limnocylindria bacterium]